MVVLCLGCVYYPLMTVLVCLVNSVLPQDIIGCGGFVKSKVEINFSLIEIKLYTKQGSLKYQTDCAPNSGYYMIPVYDKGDFVIKVEPPTGWTFEPESIDLHIDGQNDPCSKSEDLNFKFTGFGVIGRVSSRLSRSGPAGVILTLKNALTGEVVKQATSANGGHYRFEKVLPGDYVIQGSHRVWKFEKAVAKVTVGRETGKIQDDITILGYDVKGRVLGEGEPVQGVNFLLFSDEVHPDLIEGCSKEYFQKLPPDIPVQAHCHVKSDEQGYFVFESLPSGSYRLVPFYSGERIYFDVRPSELTFTVDHDSVEIKEPFQVTGFSVDGRVLTRKEGKGIPDAKIFLDGKHVATTVAKDKNEGLLVPGSTREGWYTLKNIKTRSYVLKVEAKDYFFNTTQVKVSPNTPVLPEIYATRFSVCGKVVIDKIPDGLSHLPKHRTISFRIKGQGDEVKTTVTEEDSGNFCTDVVPGDYIVKVALSETEVEAGLKLIPASRSIHVTDAPIKDLKFTQFRAEISGRILCLESCGPVHVTLVSSARPDEKQSVLSQTFTDGSRFTFFNVMPGKYKVTIQKNEWCWKKDFLEIDVTDHDITNLVLTQSGYVLSCSLSHDIVLKFAQENKEGHVGSFNLSKGVSKFCLSQPGVYKLIPVSCHLFEHDTYQYDTYNPKVLTLTAVHHKVEGVITVLEEVDDILVNVSSPIDGSKPAIYGPLKSEKMKKSSEPTEATGKEKQAQFITYTFTHWAKDGEKLTITPSSKTTLFYDNSLVVTVQGESCPGAVARFTGKRGMFLSGAIMPKLAGVHITVTPEDKNENIIDVLTDDSGSYRVGPLHSHKQYDVAAHKEGYILTRIEKTGDFKAFKLAEIIVKVTDVAGEPLGGVLLSLSGDNAYRSNNFTLTDGTMSFISLGPGQYYLRPMMKEYSFEPASQMIDLSEGAMLNIQISGKRVAFSCYGSVTSLNGEAEPEVIVEAVGRGSIDCGLLQEEAKTEKDGTFRIRGLQPKCDYIIRLHKGDANNHIERAAPPSQLVKVTGDDLRDIHIIAFRKMSQLDIGGNVITAPEYLPSLKIHLYKENNLDSPLHSTTLGSISFFYLPSLKIDHENYILRLESSLSKSSYDHSAQEFSFTANTTYKHFTFNFQPKKKSLEQELSQSSVIALPLTILALIVAYHRKAVLPLCLQYFNTLKSLATKSSVNEQPSQPKASSKSSEVEFVPKKQKLRKV